MTDLQKWELQLQQEIALIRRSGDTLAKSSATVTGRGEVRGVSIEVNASGDITNLQIAPAAMGWSSSELTNALLDCHRKARADAAIRIERIIGTADLPLRGPLREMLGENETEPAEPKRQMTEEEIQAADDAYFERINQGWRTDL
ncbi:hypothetical protein OHB12_11735 [Nocardia sp. NBC_01730]|uniref:hypothetical protein n=1 Tax=Nocardia sp. NBC_01730 TaxID=2975998 RepID=UPI002E123CA8|nr:hypothetical protein OHB12_11735 [Nocardia sp. NBC_01730]